MHVLPLHFAQQRPHYSFSRIFDSIIHKTVHLRSNEGSTMMSLNRCRFRECCSNGLLAVRGFYIWPPSKIRGSKKSACAQRLCIHQPRGCHYSSKHRRNIVKTYCLLSVHAGRVQSSRAFLKAGTNTLGIPELYYAIVYAPGFPPSDVLMCTMRRMRTINEIIQICRLSCHISKRWHTFVAVSLLTSNDCW